LGDIGLPEPWVSSDIGAVGVAGYATYHEGTAVIAGSGADFWHTNDGGHYAYVEWSGDIDITCHVNILDPTDWWAKAGIMIRSDLSDDSAMVYMAVNAADGDGDRHQMIWRDFPGAGTGIHDHFEDGLIPGSSYIRLKRVGGRFDGYYSSDGVNWTSIGSATTPQINDPCCIGFGVTSHNNDRVAGAEFDGITLTVP